MLLTTLIILPLIFAVITLVVGKDRVRGVSLFLSFVQLIFSFRIFRKFDWQSDLFQLIEKSPWMKEVGVYYHVGLDHLSLCLTLFSGVIFPIVIMASWSFIHKYEKTFYPLLFVLQACLTGAFLAIDAILLFCFCEIAVLLILLLALIWTPESSRRHILKTFIPVSMGSMFILLGILYLIFQCDNQLGGLSASLTDFYKLKLFYVKGLLLNPQNLVFFLFLLSILMRLMAFPFHGIWKSVILKGPTPVVMFLPFVLMGTSLYVSLRLIVPIFQQSLPAWSDFILVLGCIGMIYGALMAAVQLHWKDTVFYMMVSGFGCVVLGLFSQDTEGFLGATLLTLGYSLGACSLIFIIDVLVDSDKEQRGLDFKAAPVLSGLMVILILFQAGAPLTSVFQGERFVLNSVSNQSILIPSFMLLGLALGTLSWLILIVKMFGFYGPRLRRQAKELTSFQTLVAGTLVFSILILSIQPTFFEIRVAHVKRVQ